jgi:hypothetical protein
MTRIGLAHYPFVAVRIALPRLLRRGSYGLGRLAGKCALTPMASASWSWPAGHAGAAAERERAGDQHPQPRQLVWAGTLGSAKPLPGSGDLVLRVPGKQTAQDADLVRPSRG